MFGFLSSTPSQPNDHQPVKVIQETLQKTTLEEVKEEPTKAVQPYSKFKTTEKDELRSLLSEYLGVPNDDEDDMDLDAAKCREKVLMLLKTKLMNGINHIIERYGGYAMECEVPREDVLAITNYFFIEKKMRVMATEPLDETSPTILKVSWSKLDDPFTNVRAYKCPSDTLNTYLRNNVVAYRNLTGDYWSYPAGPGAYVRYGTGYSILHK